MDEVATVGVGAGGDSQFRVMADFIYLGKCHQIFHCVDLLLCINHLNLMVKSILSVVNRIRLIRGHSNDRSLCPYKIVIEVSPNGIIQLKFTE